MFRSFLIHSDVNHFLLAVLRSHLALNATLPCILSDNSINLHTHYLCMWSTQKSAQSWLDVSTQIEMNEGASTPIAGAGDSPHCIVFAVFIIWFSCLTIHLGPTFLSGGLTTSDGGHLDVCTMIYKPVRHYVLNVLWVLVNMMCAGLMGIHLRKLYRDIVKSNLEAVRLASMVTTMIPLRSEADEANQSTLKGYIQKLEEEGSSRVRMYVVILSAYILCWGPLYVVTLAMPGELISPFETATLSPTFVEKCLTKLDQKSRNKVVCM